MEDITKRNILAVDDAGESLVTIRSILRNNYNIFIAKTGAIGFQVLERITVDLILLDIRMPEMDGFEFVEKMRENQAYKDIPIIFVTSSTNPDFITKAARYGAQGYILKPLEPEFLLKKIEELFKTQTHKE